MHREPAAIHIICFLAKEIEKLRIAHGQKEVERVVCVRHDHEQRSLTISQGVQFQLVISRQVAQFLNVKGREARTTGDQNGFRRFP